MRLIVSSAVLGTLIVVLTVVLGMAVPVLLGPEPGGAPTPTPVPIPAPR